MKKQSNTPKIRFHNYKELWECDDLKNIFGTIRNAFVGTATPYYVEKGNFYLESNNVKNGKINYKSQIFINDEFYEKQRDKWLKTNDIVMVQSGHVGHTAVIPKELNNTAAHALIVFTDYKKEVNPHFLNYQFQSSSKRKELDLISTGNTIKHILASEMKSFKMDFPTVEEQSAIGSLFRTLDDLLASYKDNLANYQSLKASMLSKMFPKAGQTVPEIRLDGFEGEWTFSSLGEQADITKLAGFEFTNHVVYSDEGVIPAIRGLNVKNQKIDLSDVKYIDKSDFSKLDRSKLVEDDLLFTYVGTVGEVARVPESVLWYLAPNVSRIRLNMALDSRFVLYQMASNRFKQKQISPLIATSSQPALSMANIRKFIISFTTLEEQCAIGAYFSNLDNLINSYQEKISQLETLKKKLLQDMFI